MTTETVINLFKGHPTPRLLPTKEVTQATASLLNRERSYDDDPEDCHPLCYGADQGSLQVRNIYGKWFHDRELQQPLIRDYFARHNVDQPDAWALNLTNGASHAMLLLLQQCTAPEIGYTRRAFIVSPTYYLINYIFNDAGFVNKLTAIKDDANLETRIDLEALERELAFYDAQEDTPEAQAKLDEFAKVCQERGRKVYKYVMYLVPTYSNPRGDTYSLSVRTKLVQLARKYDMLIVSDDVYDLLSFPENPKSPEAQLPPRLVSIDRATLPRDTDTPIEKQYGNTVSNLTFSKLLGPGLRVGWQESATPLLCQQLSRAGANRSGGTAAQLTSMVVAEMIILGLADPVIAQLCQTYGDRARKMKQAMVTHLPKGTHIEGGEGGYFFWVTMPESIDAHEMCNKLKLRGVIVGNGDGMEVDNNPFGWGQRAVRVSLSFNEADAAVEAIERWGQVCQEMLSH